MYAECTRTGAFSDVSLICSRLWAISHAFSLRLIQPINPVNNQKKDKIHAQAEGKSEVLNYHNNIRLTFGEGKSQYGVEVATRECERVFSQNRNTASMWGCLYSHKKETKTATQRRNLTCRMRARVVTGV